MPLSRETIQEILTICRQAAAAGARVLDEAIDGEIHVHSKGEKGDVFTQVDVAAEKAVREFLSQARPFDSVEGEELASTGAESAEFRWSIDPVDGTSNLVKGLPHFGTSVGVQHIPSRTWVAGSVIAPELKKEYYAAIGLGAFVDYRGKTRQITGASPDSETVLFGTGFSYDPKSREQQYADLPRHMQYFTDIRSVGSAALGLCLAAEGAVDAFVETDCYEFDWAAGALIAEEAGLTVYRPDTHRGSISAYPQHLKEARLTS